MTPPVVRFDEFTSLPAASVARFGEDEVDPPQQGACDEAVRMFDRIHAAPAAPVAQVGNVGTATAGPMSAAADPIAVAKEICLRLLTDRARTRHELTQALARKGVPAEAARTVLERFDEVGLIDDAAFAGQWVRSRHDHRGLARRALAAELRRKGVDDEVASEALEEIDQESEEHRARELVHRKLRTIPADTPEQRRKAATRLVGMLARKGYGGGVAYRVVREALAVHGAELDEPATDPLD
jgi:regulatory protein